MNGFYDLELAGHIYPKFIIYLILLG